MKLIQIKRIEKIAKFSNIRISFILSRKCIGVLLRLGSGASGGTRMKSGDE
jgi:hypothetical protein